MKHFYISSGSFDTFIDADTLDMGAVKDLGIGTYYGRLAIQKKTEPERIFRNQTFNIIGAGGRDTVAYWEEINNVSGNGAVTQDIHDLLKPKSFSQHSCRIEMGVNPGNEVGLKQSARLDPDTQYYAVVEYKNDSASEKINSPLSVVLYDETNKRYWDHYAAIWDAKYSYMELPLSLQPTSISLPFVSPAGNSVIQLQMLNRQYGNDASGVVHHIYSAAVQKNKESNPAPDNVSPPTSGSWTKGDIIWNTEPAPNSSVGWICISDGSPGIWKPFATIEK